MRACVRAGVMSPVTSLSPLRPSQKGLKPMCQFTEMSGGQEGTHESINVQDSHMQVADSLIQDLIGNDLPLSLEDFYLQELGVVFNV